MSIALAAMAGMGIILGERLAPFTLAGLNAVTWAILIAYGFGIRLTFYDQQFAAIRRGQPDSLSPPTASMTLPKAIGGYVISAGVIFVAGPFLAKAAATFGGIDRTGADVRWHDLRGAFYVAP